MVTKGTPNRLRAERSKRGWLQADLAARTGLAPSVVSVYENSNVFPDPKNIGRLADAFGVAPDEVFRWLLEPAEKVA